MGQSIKLRLTVMSFMQFFVWGAWLITIYNFWFETKKWGGVEFGAIFTTLGISSVLMPTVTGIIADRWINAERLYGILHLVGGGIMCSLPFVNDPQQFFWAILAAMCCYMPTISLSNSVAYNILKSANFDLIKVFPPIRVWGTIGFIAAMWIVNLTGNKASSNQFFISGIAQIALAIYAFTLPKCPPVKETGKSLVQTLGLDAFRLFGQYKMFLFFFFSLLLGAALQLTNMYGDGYVNSFGNFGEYQDSWVVRYSTIIMSISQVSETLFILAIPFFLKRFGIKRVMIISMLAWVIRFGLLAFGDPAGGVWMIIVSCIAYGMAFDFFNVSGSLFLENNVPGRIRSSAQGLFMMMTNGFGAMIGSMVSAIVISKYFTLSFSSTKELTAYLGVQPDNEAFVNMTSRIEIASDGTFSSAITMPDWQPIWITFALYAFVIAVLFTLLFRHKHNPKEFENIQH